MAGRNFLSIAAVLLVLACSTDARHHSLRSAAAQEYSEEVGPQARVFPGALAIKKLVLLKFKKVIPISLILLKSNNENEAELVPVYPTSEIPENVQFIPTPNGISGHKDVQAIAIPNELQEQLESSGMNNLENIEALINGAVELPTAVGNSIAMNDMPKEDEPLDIKEDDEDQLLEVVTKQDKTDEIKSTLRRIKADDVAKTKLKEVPHQTVVEEIPLFLYSVKDTPQVVYAGRRATRRHIAGQRQ